MAPSYDPPSTPEDALRRLLEGNARFRNDTPLPLNRKLERLQELGTAQAPFVAILGCADSRVPVELLFDQGLGDLFVTRVAGNLATAEIIGSLEYAAEKLGAVLLLVLGHSGCGAVQATKDGAIVPGLIGSLYPYIHPAAVSAGERGINAVIEENVRNQVNTLRYASPVLSARMEAGTLGIEGAVFDFTTGEVRQVDVPAWTRPAGMPEMD